MFAPRSFGPNPSNPGMSRCNASLRRKRPLVRLRPFLESLEPKIAPATFTWTGLGSSNNWSVSQNWTHTGTPNNPVPTSTSDVIFFPAGSPRKNTVNDLSEEGSTFNSVTIQDSGYNISGYGLTLHDGITYSGTGSSTYAINTTYTAANSINVNSGQLLHSGSVRLGANVVITVGTGAQLTLTGGLRQSDSRTLTKSGGGLLILNSTATHTGATTVNAGVYQVDGSCTTSPITVNAGSTLCGTGTVRTVTSVGGTITAGDQPSGVGTLTVAGLSLDSASTFSAEIVSATSYDRVVSSGSIGLGGAALVLSGGYGTTPSDRLTLIKNSPGTAVTNTFAALPENSVVTVGSGSLRISYSYNDGSTLNNVVLRGISATTTTLNVPGGNPTYGQSITFSANVSAAGSTPTAGTSIQLYVDSTLLQTSTIDASGNATFIVSRLIAGGHTVSVKYLGNDTYAPSQSATNFVTVNQAGLTVTGVTGADRVYDATTSATISTTSAALSDVIGSDSVTLGTSSATGVFQSKTVGTGKNVIVAGLTISGPDAANYLLTQPIVTASITPATLTVSGLIALNRDYDGTVTASLNTASAGIVGKFAGDTVILNTGGALGQFASKVIGTAKTVTISGLTITGTDAANYILTPPSATANITAKALVGSITAADKVYDATAVATITSRTLSGVIPGDNVAYNGGIASFASFHVGTVVTVTATGLSLTGADAGNYTINSTAQTTADINPATLTITPINQSKIYGTLFTFTGTEFTTVGLMGEDTVTSVTFACGGTPANAHVSPTPYAILASDAVGTGLDDYTINYAAGQFTVDPKSLTVTATAQNKVYDATNVATVTLSTDHVAGDTVTAAYTSATFSDKNAGTGKTVSISGITIGGADAENYVLVDPSTTTMADITARGLTVTATGNDRGYDGTTGATVNLLTNKLTGDAVTASYSSATFADKNVGLSKPIIVSGITIDGADAGNYIPLDTSTTTTATISARTLAGTVTVASKQYDETNSATILSRDLGGVVSGDNVQYIGGTATFADIHVGASIPVTAEGLSLAGADSANYTVNTTATTSADITLRTLTITPKPVTKTYGETVPFTGASTEYSAEGLLPDDSITSLTITSAGGPGSAGVAGSPYAIVASNASGIGLEDYDIQYVNGSLSVNPVALTVTGVTAAGKVYDATTTATIDTTAASLVGILEGDDISLNSSGQSGAFNTKDVGAGKTVTVSGLALTGTAAGNYVLTQPTTTANITAKVLYGQHHGLPQDLGWNHDRDDRDPYAERCLRKRRCLLRRRKCKLRHGRLWNRQAGDSHRIEPLRGRCRELHGQRHRLHHRRDYFALRPDTHSPPAAKGLWSDPGIRPDHVRDCWSSGGRFGDRDPQQPGSEFDGLGDLLHLTRSQSPTLPSLVRMPVATRSSTSVASSPSHRNRLRSPASRPRIRVMTAIRRRLS